MTPSALSLAAKKAYVKIFNGKASWKKRIAGAALVLGTPFMIPSTGETELSIARDAGIGERQYQALHSETEKLSASAKKVQLEYREAYELSQQSLTEPDNKDLVSRAEKAQQAYGRDNAWMQERTTGYRNRVILAQGISEMDAVDLVKRAEVASGYTFFPRWGEDWKKELRYMNECQNKAAVNDVAKPLDERAEKVMLCMRINQEKASLYDGGLGVLGAMGSGFSLVLFSVFGRAVRRGMWDHERRVEKELEEKKKSKQEKLEDKSNFVIKIKK